MENLQAYINQLERLFHQNDRLPETWWVMGPDRIMLTDRLSLYQSYLAGPQTARRMPRIC